LGPVLFTAYIAPLGNVITSCGVRYHQYADDTTLYISVDPATPVETFAIEKCTDKIKAWCDANDMQLNPSKSEAMYIGTALQLKRLDSSVSLSLAGSGVRPVDSVHIIGVTLDKNLSFDKHVTELCQSCNYHIRALQHIRPMMDESTASMIACSIVASKLDYCNSLLYGTSSHNIQRLQRVQNNLARAVCRVSRRDASSMDLLRRLHWLPIPQRIQYKIAIVTYMATSTGSPHYLRELITPYNPTRTLRSSSASLLRIPPRNNITASKAFCVASPTIWNALPVDLRSMPSISTFKSKLKTVLFNAPLIT
jgi:hypothetical protein